MASWAIVIGINEYPALSGQKALAGAVADAADFADWLLDPEGGGVPAENLFFWTTPAPRPEEMTERVTQFMTAPTAWPFAGPDFKAAPSAGLIVANLCQIVERGLKKGCDRLYVFLAGHGARTVAQNTGEEAQNCFVAGDFIKGYETAGLMNCDDMKRYLKSQGPAESLIFLDCCRNDLPLRILRPGIMFSNATEDGEARRQCTGRAAEENAAAFEVPLASPTRGAFTQLLTFGLREIRHDGHLTLAKLEEYVTGALAEVIQPPKSQTPDFDERPKKPPKMVIVSGAPKGVLPHITIVPSGSDPIDLLADDESLIRTIDPAHGTLTMPLAVGAYSLERNGNTLKAFNHVGPGTPDIHV